MGHVRLREHDAMLNDVRPPPVDTPAPTATRETRFAEPALSHLERAEPGLHHTRYVGEPTQTDPLYAMPFEERGSNFNIAMSIVAIAMFGSLIAVAWWTLG